MKYDRMKVMEMMRTLRGLENVRKRKEDEYDMAKEACRNNESNMKSECEDLWKEGEKEYDVYLRELSIGEVKSVRGVLKSEFLDFAKCLRSSVTVVLANCDGKQAITMGKHGLGFRWNMKSRQICNYDVDRVAKNSDTIIKTLKEKKKLKEAEAMEKFFANGVSELLSSEDAEIIYEEFFNESFPVVVELDEYEEYPAKSLRVEWDSDGKPELCIMVVKDNELSKFVINRYGRYSYANTETKLKIEMTKPFVLNRMEGFTQRAKVFAQTKLKEREELITKAVEPLMPYLLAKRL